MPRKNAPSCRCRAVILFVYFTLSVVHVVDLLSSYSRDSFCKMPGKISNRTSVAPRVARKSSAQTLASRRSTTSAAINIPREILETSLRTEVSSIFSNAQRTTASHRKLVVSLRKVQETCCYGFISHVKKYRGDFDEDDFNAEVARCIIRLIVIRKSESVGDRVVRFLGSFLRHANEKGIKAFLWHWFGQAGNIAQTWHWSLTQIWMRLSHSLRPRLPS